MLTGKVRCGAPEPDSSGPGGRGRGGWPSECVGGGICRRRLPPCSPAGALLRRDSISNELGMWCGGRGFNEE